MNKEYKRRLVGTISLIIIFTITLIIIAIPSFATTKTLRDGVYEKSNQAKQEEFVSETLVGSITLLQNQSFENANINLLG